MTKNKLSYTDLPVWMANYLRVILVLVVGFVIVVNLIKPLSGLFSIIPKEYNEGWNAYEAAAAVGQLPLYPESSSALTILNNYPPLSFYIIGTLGLIFGDNIFVGRMLSFISLLIVSVNIGLICRRLGASTLIAVFCPLVFLGYVTEQYPTYVAMNDPQWLGHAFVTTGFLVFLYRNGRTSWLIMSIILIFIGGMIKHILVPLPLAIGLWLFIYQRRSFYIFVGIGISFIILSMIFCYLAYGPPFFTSIFAAPRVFSLKAALSRFWLSVPLAPLLITSAIVPLVNKRPEAKLLLMYVIASAIWGALTLGGEGVNYNALFDLTIGLSIVAAMMLEAVVECTTHNRLAAQISVMAIFVWVVIQTMPKVVGETRTYLESFSTSIATSKEDIRYLAETSGPAMCEDLALCYWAGKPFEVDFFFTGQNLFVGRFSEQQVIDVIEGKRFAVIHMGDRWHPKPTTERLPESIVNAILANYEVDRYSDVNGFFLRARPPDAGSKR